MQVENKDYLLSHLRDFCRGISIDELIIKSSEVKLNPTGLFKNLNFENDLSVIRRK